MSAINNKTTKIVKELEQVINKSNQGLVKEATTIAKSAMNMTKDEIDSFILKHGQDAYRKKLMSEAGKELGVYGAGGNLYEGVKEALPQAASAIYKGASNIFHAVGKKAIEGKEFFKGNRLLEGRIPGAQFIGETVAEMGSDFARLPGKLMSNGTQENLAMKAIGNKTANIGLGLAAPVAMGAAGLTLAGTALYGASGIPRGIASGIMSNKPVQPDRTYQMKEHKYNMGASGQMVFGMHNMR